MQVLRTEQPRCARCKAKLTSSSLDDYSISFDELDAVVVSNDASVADPSSVDSTRPATPEQPRSDDSRSTGMHLACIPTSVRLPSQTAAHVALGAPAAGPLSAGAWNTRRVNTISSTCKKSTASQLEPGRCMFQTLSRHA